MTGSSGHRRVVCGVRGQWPERSAGQCYLWCIVGSEVDQDPLRTDLINVSPGRPPAVCKDWEINKYIKAIISSLEHQPGTRLSILRSRPISDVDLLCLSF